MPKGAALADALKDMFTASDIAEIRDFNIETFECMSACVNPVAISFRAKGKAAYMFSGIDPEKDQQDILAFACLYIAAKDGWIEDARPCGRLRFCLLGRIPADPITAPE
jgi:predicted metal-binding protein